MKVQSKIPVSKVERASRFMKTGVKVGRNYLKHYGKKAFNKELDKSNLHKQNAEDIYNSLSELKGSVLKVAQMMSMDKNIMPTAYQNKFAMAQYSAPPLSYPLVLRTFKKYFGKGPDQIFDTFSKSAVNAASIGQVHQATLNGKKLAVKIQYPGVAQSVRSDLKLAKPFASRLFNISKKDLDHYMEEIESKLLEETDYELELKRSIELSSSCSSFDNIVFPIYYPEYSNKRIITMDWIDGLHLHDFIETNPGQFLRDKLGQTLWDFYSYQIYNLKQVHADPHPGNFIVQPGGKLGVLDFGCVKVIPEVFHSKYFSLITKDVIGCAKKLEQVFYDLQYIYPEDNDEEKALFIRVFKQMIQLLGKPFLTKEFDFSNNKYFQSIYLMGEHLSKVEELRNSKKARSSKDSLYINKTYLGLYNLLNQLGAKVKTRRVKLSKVA